MDPKVTAVAVDSTVVLVYIVVACGAGISGGTNLRHGAMGVKY